MRVGPNHTKFTTAQKESGIVAEFCQLIVVSVPDPCEAQTNRPANSHALCV